MEQLIKLVTEKTGISESQATAAVNTVVNYMKDKLPAGLGSQVDSLLKGGGIGDIAGGLKDKVGDIFGK
jgi:hypothetical protein